MRLVPNLFLEKFSVHVHYYFNFKDTSSKLRKSRNKLLNNFLSYSKFKLRFLNLKPDIDYRNR